MPIVHCHSLESQALALDVHLAAHIASHHARDFGHGAGGWHLHFVMPSSGGDDDGPVDDDSTAPSLAWPTALLESAGYWTSGDFAPPVVMLPDLPDAQLVVWLADADQPAAAPLSVPIPKRISPQAWLCVARC